jgi:hypothetical protein
MSMPHVCKCGTCGKEMDYGFAALRTEQCLHHWGEFKQWNDASGEHGSKRCIACGKYLQW